jgi:hypothetical protein
MLSVDSSIFSVHSSTFSVHSSMSSVDSTMITLYSTAVRVRATKMRLHSRPERRQLGSPREYRTPNMTHLASFIPRHPAANVDSTA